MIKNLISRKRFRIFEEEEFFFDRFRKKNMYLKQLCYCKYLKKEENADMLKNSCDWKKKSHTKKCDLKAQKKITQVSRTEKKNL